MSKINRIWAGVLSFALIFALIAIGVFAYFRITAEDDGELGVSSEDERVEIRSFSALMQFADAGVHNDGSPASDADMRKTLVLTEDIRLEANVFITADCHIDLGGNTLSLNGHTLTLTHGYHGSTVISGGTVLPYSEAGTDSDGNEIPPVQGKLVFDLPHSEAILDGLEFRDESGEVISDTEDVVKILWQESGNAADEKYAAYNALYTVASSLINEYDHRPMRLTYDEVSALDTLSLAAVLDVRYSCESCTDDSICLYTSLDLDLPTSYLSTDVRIDYSSDNSCLSASGNVILPSGLDDATLTVNVTSGAVTVSDTAVVHVYNPDAADAALTYAKTMLLTSIYPHLEDGTYVFNRGIQLPLKIGGLTFEYTVYSDSEGTAELIGAFEEITADYLINFEPTVDSKLLVVNITDGSTVLDTLRLDMQSGNTGIITTNASVAKNIVQSWYGSGEFTINPILDAGVITDYTSHLLIEHTETLLTKYGISAVEYELMNNSYGVYEIVPSINGEILRVVTGMNPADYVQDVFVNCKFTFDGSLSNASLEQIQLPIIFDDSEQGDNVNRFLPYYTYYNEMLYGTLAGSTSHSFEIPFCYGTAGPIICYDVLVYNSNNEPVKGCPAFLTVALYYNGAEQVEFDYDGVTDGKDSMTELLDLYLESASVSLQDIIDAGDAKWLFKLNSELTPSTDTPIELVYNYKMDVRALSWSTYPTTDEPITSKLTLLGILHLGSDVTSEALYEWIYNSFNVSGDEYVSYDDGDYIVADWLKQNVSIDVTDTGAAYPFPTDSSLSFKGLEYLIGTKYLDLTAHPALQNEGTADEAARAISEMTSLETLILSENLFRDRASGASTDLGTVSLFSALTNLKYLYVDANGIYSFEWLLPIVSLERVYVHSNTHTGLEQVFYGSEGLVNLEVFRELTDRGVSVYNGISGGNEVLFEKTAEVNDYTRLRSVEYQKKLATGVDISTLYASLSTDAEAYDLSQNYTYSTTDANGNVTTSTTDTVTHSLTFSHNGDGTEAVEFTLTDTITVGTTTVVVVIKFEIIRY